MLQERRQERGKERQEERREGENYLQISDTDVQKFISDSRCASVEVF